MKPIWPLMSEHRLIERMVKLLDKELQSMKKTSSVKTNIISLGTDFFKIYADRTHHGKEEDILFKELSTKQLSTTENQMMECLIQEHIWARQAVTRLIDANSRYIRGDTTAMKEMVYELEKLVKFYPLHIEKEDRHFFVPVMAYFSETEQRSMLERFWDFDRKIIHEKYKKVVEEMEWIGQCQ
jgi:hemerythrin-like domain-containing protein